LGRRRSYTSALRIVGLLLDFYNSHLMMFREDTVFIRHAKLVQRMFHDELHILHAIMFPVNRVWDKEKFTLHFDFSANLFAHNLRDVLANLLEVP